CPATGQGGGQAPEEHGIHEEALGSGGRAPGEVHLHGQEGVKSQTRTTQNGA
ncbi:unnamed protein product, partial [Amoebophrya sp. A120]